MVKLDISNLHKAGIQRTKSKETLKIAHNQNCAFSGKLVWCQNSLKLTFKNDRIWCRNGVIEMLSTEGFFLPSERKGHTVYNTDHDMFIEK